MKNLVHIETYNIHGSGIIFPCEYNNQNSYLIMTNFHVVKELSKVIKNAKTLNLKDYVDFEIYDKNEELISKKFIISVYLAHGFVFEDKDDVAAFLLVLDDVIKMDLNTNVLLDNIGNSIFTAGYPELLSDDKLNRRLIAAGNIVSTFPKIQNMGYYKMKDIFHFYKDLTDKDLFEGLSGGPVYKNNGKLTYIIGMNQSISNCGDGKNPYNIVYFIEINHVLNRLRLSGVIVYLIHEDNLMLKWIYNLNRCFDNKNILLLGSSGAGKSSFVKELMYHGEIVSASGDGQTTRMDVHYNLSNYTIKPNIKIEFFNIEEFVEHITGLMRLSHIKYAFTVILGLESLDITKNESAYLQYIYNNLNVVLCIFKDSDLYLEMLDDGEVVLSEMSFVINKSDKAEKEELIAIYEEVIELLIKIENNCFNNNDIIKEIFDMNKYEKFLESNLTESYIIEAQHEKHNEKMYKYIEKLIEEQRNNSKDICDTRFTRLKNKTKEDRIELFKALNYSKGYFDINEFEYINEVITEKIKKIVDEYKFLLDAKYDEYFKKVIDGSHYNKNTIDEYYKKIYDVLWNEFSDKYSPFVLNNSNNIKFIFDEVSKNEIEFISQSLRVVNGNSCTGIVKKVEIEDLFSNEYAYIMSNKEIDKLTLIDTCGLDHIDRGNGINRYLTNKFLKFKESEIEFNAIFYLKKLDSGKPTEIDSILPLIFDISPGTPLYCIFTGADIYYMNREELLLNYKWSAELHSKSNELGECIIPKSVSHMYENKNIVNGLKCSIEWKNVIYQVITKNLVPFVSDTKNKNNSIYTESNRYYIDKLINSVLMDEWNSGYITFRAKFDDLDNEIKAALLEDLKKMFYNSSIFSWNYRHHMTINANVNRLLKSNNDYFHTMGYNGVFIDRWDILLKNGYKKVFLGNHSHVVDLFSRKGMLRNQVEVMFAKLINEIIELDMMYMEETSNKLSKFRTNFESMYDAKNENNEPIYKYNIFKNDTIELSGQHEKKSFLADVCNFRKGLNNIDISEKYCEIFLDKIKEYIEAENGERIKRLLKYNIRFRENVKSITEEVEMFSSESSEEVVLRIINDVFNEALIAR